ncbi:MAG: hypothetical protein WC782_06115 [Methylococcaceae bacterium]|jgi:hypothetical protein
MGNIELTKLFCGEKNWQNFVLLVSKKWEEFPDKEKLLDEVNGNEEIAKVVAFRVGINFLNWLNSEIPALDKKSPKWCIQHPEDLNGLKELLLRMP